MTAPPAPYDIGDLTDRARDIFRHVVESYLATGAPVGSRTIAQAGGLNLSPASIRGVMQDLEGIDLLTAPHTSAGRMPTIGGLRLFVDGMMQVDEPDAAIRAQIEAQLDGDGPVEDALAAATMALSGLSSCAGLVLVPKSEPVLRQMSFVPLSETQTLAVLVGSDGSVENRILELAAPIPDSALIEAGNYVSAMLAGLTLPQAQARLRGELENEKLALDRAASDLIARGLAIWSEDAADRPVLIVRGAANLIDEAAAGDIERVRGLLDALESKQEIARLLGLTRDGQATRIFIGAENELFSLSGSSVIAAPYRNSEDRVVGVVGVIGPIRLNYARIVPMVDFTAQMLSRLMR